MGIKRIKISNLPMAETISGLWTIGVDALNRSVKVSLEFLKSAADSAINAANSAIAAAKSAEKSAEAANTSSKNAQSATTAANDSASLAKSAAKNANSAAEQANKAAGLANDAVGKINSKATKVVPTASGNFATLSSEGDLQDSHVNISAYADKYPYELEVLSKHGEKSNIYCRVHGVADNEDISELRVFLMRTLKKRHTGHRSKDGNMSYKDIIGWRHPVHNQIYQPIDKVNKLYPFAPQFTEFPIQKGEFLIGNVLDICIKPYTRYISLSSGSSSTWYIRLGNSYVDSSRKKSSQLSMINRDYGFAVFRVVDGTPLKVSKIVPFNISACIVAAGGAALSLHGNVYP